MKLIIKHSKSRLYAFLTFSLLCLPLCVFADALEQSAAARPATITELNELFSVVKKPKPLSSRIVANVDIEDFRIQYRKSDSGHGVAASPRKSSLRIQEWASGNSYRIDECDKSKPSVVSSNAEASGFQNTFVEVYDTTIYPYYAFEERYQSHAVLLFPTRNKSYTHYDLWQLSGIDEMGARPLRQVLALSESAVPPGADSIKMSATKAQQLLDGTDALWKLDVTPLVFDGISVNRFQLNGEWLDPQLPGRLSAIQVSYGIGRVAGQLVCLQVEFTNMTFGTSFTSMRQDFDGSGFPHKWKTVSRDKQGLVKIQECLITYVEIPAHFNNQSVFTPNYTTDYTVGEVSRSGGRLIQKPNAGLRPGVGISFEFDTAFRGMRIAEVASNSPACRAGIVPGFVLTSIDGQSVSNMSPEECAHQLGGPLGSKVRLDLVAPDRSVTNIVELTRQKIF